jgi:tetratricopeptide (TPR) repeat protein
MVADFTKSKQVLRFLTPPRLVQTVSAALVSLAVCVAPSLAGDPFRTSNPRQIDDRTESVFRAFFEEGNYAAAKDKLKVMLQPGQQNDPLALAMGAAVAYADINSSSGADKQAALERFRSFASRTRVAAGSLGATDDLRSKLYLGVSDFLDGADILLTKGTVNGTPDALNKAQNAFKLFEAAAAQSPNDPEVNLIKGFTDLFISLNLPFSSPSQAIARLEKYAGPKYLADRGAAIGYRELNQQAKALEAVNRSLQAAPNNPEVMYLKAQILVRQGNFKASLPLFDQALAKKNQLAPATVQQIQREYNRAKKRAGA